LNRARIFRRVLPTTFSYTQWEEIVGLLSPPTGGLGIYFDYIPAEFRDPTTTRMTMTCAAVEHSRGCFVMISKRYNCESAVLSAQCDRPENETHTRRRDETRPFIWHSSSSSSSQNRKKKKREEICIPEGALLGISYICTSTIYTRLWIVGMLCVCVCVCISKS
jgi:hypothetical protein